MVSPVGEDPLQLPPAPAARPHWSSWILSRLQKIPCVGPERASPGPRQSPGVCPEPQAQLVSHHGSIQTHRQASCCFLQVALCPKPCAQNPPQSKADVLSWAPTTGVGYDLPDHINFIPEDPTPGCSVKPLYLFTQTRLNI